MRTIRKTVSFIIVFCMMLTGIFLQTAYARNNDYPHKYRGTSRTDEWNFSGSSCASFVAWRLNKESGIAFNSNYGGKDWSELKSWGNNAKELGLVVDNNPTVGSIAWWDVDNSNLLLKFRDKGFVAWVESVNGSNVSVEEYDYKFMLAYDDRVIGANEPTGYIHFKDLGDVKQTDSDKGENGQVNSDKNKQNQIKTDQDKENQNNQSGNKQPLDNNTDSEAGVLMTDAKKSGLKYKINLTEEQVQKALDSLEEADSDVFKIDLSNNVVKKFKKITLTMTKDALDILLDSEVQSLQIWLPENTIYIDAEALEEIGDITDEGKIVFTIKRTMPKVTSEKEKKLYKDLCTLDIKAGSKKIKSLSEGKVEADNMVTNLSKKEMKKHLIWFYSYRIVIN